MKMKSVKIVLLDRDGRKLAEQELAPGGEPVSIGRSHACALRIDDASVSSRHARVFWKGGSVCIEDTQSRNGVFADGKRIDRPMRVEADGVYALGNCRLKFEFGRERKAVGKPTLEQVAGATGGRKILPIASARKDRKGNLLFGIGLNPTNELKLNDPLVSRQHATIRVNSAGESWIEDGFADDEDQHSPKGSVNGTYVNKERLAPGRLRLLKTGDRISIAYFEFVYRDGSTPPPPPVRRYVIVLLMLGLSYGAFYLLRNFILPVPDAEYYRGKARVAASVENFAEALALCAQADEAKNGSRERDLTAKLRDQVGRWSATYEALFRLRDLLSRGQVELARQETERVRDLDFAFTWDTPETGDDARKARDELEFAARLIDVHVDAKIMLGKVAANGATLEELRRLKARLEEELKLMTARIKAVAYLQPLKKAIEGSVTTIGTVLDGVEGVDRVLNSIAVSREGAFSFRTVVAELERIAASDKLPAMVRAYARGLLPVCLGFVETEKFLEREKLGIVDLDLAGVRKGEKSIPLPSQDDCARHAKLSDARADFQKIHDAYQKVASNLRPMVTGLAECGIRDGEKGSLVTRTLDPAVWEKVLAFDCFARDYPKPSRVDPTSVYDEIVGIEYGYSLLRDLPKPPGRMMEMLMHFTPKCQTAKQAVERARTFANYLDREENAAFRAGKLGDLLTLVKAVILDRDKLVAGLKQKSKTSGGAPLGRAELVAGLFAEYFSDEPAYGALRKLENGFRTLQKSINELNEEYERVGDPEKRIAMRPQFLDRGIPGMPIVRMIWGEMQPE